MANAPHFKDDEEREISRGGKATAIWTLALALFVISGGIAAIVGFRHIDSSHPLPGSAAEKTKTPSP